MLSRFLLLLLLSRSLSCHYRSAVSDAAVRMLRAARADAALKEEGEEKKNEAFAGNISHQTQ